jgi:phosphatidylglycerol---prolipoprotein diacylglyceryl transferase
MQGRLFTFFDIPFPSYFTLLLVGFVIATVAGAIWAKRIGQDPDVVVDLGLAMLLAGAIGGRLMHVIADGYFWDYVHLCTDPSKVDWQITRAECTSERYAGVWDAAKQVCHPTATDCWAWAKFWGGGFAYYGGFILASTVGWFLLKRDRFPFWKAADMAGMVIPIGLGFGRLGCLLAGCCFGAPTDKPWALSFPPNSPASESQWKAELIGSKFEPSLPVHPTQIYESAGSFAIAAVMILWLHGRKRYDGQVFLAFVALYAIVRFLLEFWRRDDRGALLGLSSSQLIGLVLIAGVVVLHRRLLARVHRPAPAL